MRQKISSLPLFILFFFIFLFAFPFHFYFLLYFSFFSFIIFQAFLSSFLPFFSFLFYLSYILFSIFLFGSFPSIMSFRCSPVKVSLGILETLFSFHGSRSQRGRSGMPVCTYIQRYMGTRSLPVHGQLLEPEHDMCILLIWYGKDAHVVLLWDMGPPVWAISLQLFHCLFGIRFVPIQAIWFFIDFSEVCSGTSMWLRKPFPFIHLKFRPYKAESDTRVFGISPPKTLWRVTHTGGFRAVME